MMATVTKVSIEKIEEVLGGDARELLEHKCQTVPKEQLHLPGGDFVDRVWKDSDRPTRVLRSIESLLDHGRLAGTGYVSILPVDQGIEHTAGASFAPTPIYFDGAKIVELAVEGGCNAVASTFGVLGSVARRYAHRIPFICKLNHNELLTYPNHYDQILFGTVKEAWEMGAVAVGATVYFGSAESDRQLQEIAFAFHAAHELGMATVLWCYVRNPAFKKDGVNYEVAADLTGQANHLGVTIEADIIKQKLPTARTRTHEHRRRRPERAGHACRRARLLPRGDPRIGRVLRSLRPVEPLADVPRRRQGLAHPPAPDRLVVRHRCAEGRAVRHA